MRNELEAVLVQAALAWGFALQPLRVNSQAPTLGLEQELLRQNAKCF